MRKTIKLSVFLLMGTVLLSGTCFATIVEFDQSFSSDCIMSDEFDFKISNISVSTLNQRLEVWFQLAYQSKYDVLARIGVNVFTLDGKNLTEYSPPWDVNFAYEEGGKFGRITRIDATGICKVRVKIRISDITQSDVSDELICYVDIDEVVNAICDEETEPSVDSNG